MTTAVSNAFTSAKCQLQGAFDSVVKWGNRSVTHITALAKAHPALAIGGIVAATAAFAALIIGRVFHNTFAKWKEKGIQFWHGDNLKKPDERLKREIEKAASTLQRVTESYEKSVAKAKENATKDGGSLPTEMPTYEMNLARAKAVTKDLSGTLLTFDEPNRKILSTYEQATEACEAAIQKLVDTDWVNDGDTEIPADGSSAKTMTLGSKRQEAANAWIAAKAKVKDAGQKVNAAADERMNKIMGRTAPAAKESTPAAKESTPPAAKESTPAAKESTPAAKDDTSAPEV